MLVDILAHAGQDDPDFESIDEFGQDCFVPLTVGGGITRIDQVQKLLRAGADKVSINTAAYERPELINEIAKRHGVQCVVASIDVRQDGHGGYDCYSNAGQRATGREVVEWAKELEDRGAGEILITSIERDGTMQGYDLATVEMVVKAVNIPVIASGGAGNYAHMVQAVVEAGASAVATASIFTLPNRLRLEPRLRWQRQASRCEPASSRIPPVSMCTVARINTFDQHATSWNSVAAQLENRTRDRIFRDRNHVLLSR